MLDALKVWSLSQGKRKTACDGLRALPTTLAGNGSAHASGTRAKAQDIQSSRASNILATVKYRGLYLTRVALVAYRPAKRAVS